MKFRAFHSLVVLRSRSICLWFRHLSVECAQQWLSHRERWGVGWWFSRTYTHIQVHPLCICVCESNITNTNTQTYQITTIIHWNFLETRIQIMNNKYSSWRTGMRCGFGSCCFHVIQTVFLLLQLREHWHKYVGCVAFVSKRKLWFDAKQPRVCYSFELVRARKKKKLPISYLIWLYPT